ncbi:acylphosphatase [Chitinophaga nivalis]|uniref:acylphosphatase n=1 Tax=Chitinophaga nivalis TaxID=2991709 RepID=A0ABT3IPS1_9BACT|nr:acylphosphatase [Chitinophaga nivalis]MCW3464339.1 acylphosphatase [Chitinophaga nivalis]MCW3485970.1 acylphosphatase [Chitinophaga nivalis]
MVARSIVHKEIIVRGRVQRVGFRANAKNIADMMGVAGVIKNLSDGSVWISAEATPLVMEDFLAWCKAGSPNAEVTALEITEGTVQHLTGFTILYV